MEKRSNELYDFLPPINKLFLKKHGLQNGHWVGIVGEPASFKSFFTKWALKKWLEYNDNTTAVYITTEENNKNIKKSLRIIGINVDEYEKDKRLKIGSIFCNDNDEKVKNSPNGVIEFATKAISRFAERFGSFARFRFLLIIDSMSSFWAHAPAMSRTI